MEDVGNTWSEGKVSNQNKQSILGQMCGQIHVRVTFSPGYGV